MPKKKIEKDLSKLAVIYARYSSRGQTEQSIEGQIAQAEEYAKKHGLTIVHTYADRAMTGKNDNRYEFQRMLSDTAKKEFGVIILWKVDRFGRNREEIAFNKYRCKKNNVKVVYVAESIPDTPEGVILESVLEGMAEYFSLQLSQNVQRGILENAKKHKAIGGHVPLGLATDAEGYYIIDENTAPVVRMIFDLYVNGHSISNIERVLIEKGLHDRSGKPLAKNTINRILKNEKYAGVYRFKDVIYAEDAIPAIIPKTEFDRAQMLMGSKKRKTIEGWTFTDYILTDKLYCGKCETLMFGSSGFGKCGTKYNYYVCGNQRRKKTCDKKPVRQDWIEPLVLNEVQKILVNDELLEYIADRTWQYYLSEDDSAERRALERELSQTDNAIEKLTNAITMLRDPTPVLSKIDELTEQKKNLEQAIAEEKLSRGPELTKDHILYILYQFRDMDFENRDCQRRLVEVFVEAIYLYDDKIKISFNYGGRNNNVTLSELEGAEKDSSKVFVYRPTCSASDSPDELLICWTKNIFTITSKLPRH